MDSANLEQAIQIQDSAKQSHSCPDLLFTVVSRSEENLQWTLSIDIFVTVEISSIFLSAQDIVYRFASSAGAIVGRENIW